MQGNHGYARCQALRYDGLQISAAKREGQGLSMELTRRRFLEAAAAGGAWITLTGILGCEQSPRAKAIASPARGEQPWAFRSRPDLRPPAVEVKTQARGTAPGYVFVSPKKEPGASGPSEDAPMILDDSGQP